MEALAYLWKVVAAWLSVIVGISTNTEDIVALHRKGTNTWQKYGVVFVLALRGAIEAYYQVEHNLESDDQNLRHYQESLLQECNMIAVAAAIVSSVTITTYQFPGIANMHWTISAAFTFSLIASLFCVYGACTLQRLISNISNTLQFRAWLQAPTIRSTSFDGGLSTISSVQRANVATVLTLTAPKTLLDHSIRFFLLGLVGYLICFHAFSIRGNFSSDNPVILSSAGSTSTGSRNIIIVSAFALCVGISLLIAPSSYRNFNMTISDPLVDGLVQGTRNLKRASYLTPESKDTDRGIMNAWSRDAGSPGKMSAFTLDEKLCQALLDAAAAHERSSMAAKESAEADRKLGDTYRVLLCSNRAGVTSL